MQLHATQMILFVILSQTGTVMVKSKCNGIIFSKKYVGLLLVKQC